MASKAPPDAATEPTPSPDEESGLLHVRALPEMPAGTRDSRFAEDGTALLTANEARDLVDAGLATLEGE